MDFMLDARLADAPPETIRIAAALAVAFGLLYCFLGYRLFKFVIGFTGFVLAGGVAATIIGLIFSGRVVAMAVAGVLGGIAGAVALLVTYKAGVFCIGMLGGLLVGAGALAHRPEYWAPIATIGGGLVGGVAALIIEPVAMTILTAAIGAWLAINGLHLFLTEMNPTGPLEALVELTADKAIVIFAWAVLAAVGATFQFLGMRTPEKPAKP